MQFNSKECEKDINSSGKNVKNELSSLLKKLTAGKHPHKKGGVKTCENLQIVIALADKFYK
jgi:hypothetical protein